MGLCGTYSGVFRGKVVKGWRVRVGGVGNECRKMERWGASKGLDML